jgi:hypothetical protein
MNLSTKVVVAALFSVCSCGLMAQEADKADNVPQIQETAGVTSYPVAFFQDQSPATAFDMVGQLPGFSFRNSEMSRGFSGAAGNVLINGRRPSTKSTRLSDVLRRIPVSAVERIDVVRGSSPDIDMQGLPIVANVIRRPGASSSNALQARVKVFPGGETGQDITLERVQQEDGLLLEGGLTIDNDRSMFDYGDGPYRAQDAAGTVTEEGRFFADNWRSSVQATGAVTKELETGILRGNILIGARDNEDNESYDIQTQGGSYTERTVTVRKSKDIEVGGDYSHDLDGGGTLEIIGVQSLEWETDDSRDVDPGGVGLSNEKGRAGESILRGSWRTPMSESTHLELGLEGAFNFLDAQSTLTENGTTISLPSANVLVEETRTELFSTLTYQGVENLSLDFGVRAEDSEITVTGGADVQNQFSFVKPRMMASYSLGGGTQLRARVEREVGQLDFGDFAAGAEFSNDTVNAGNPNLSPESAWVYEIGIEQPILEDGAINLAYRHYEIEDVLDVILVSGFAAPGNIGDGTRDVIAASLALPLSFNGFDLGLLQLDGTWRDSEVTDSVTGETREISGERPFSGDLTYTRDFPSLDSTFGIRATLPWEETNYRIDQISFREYSGFWRIYWDWQARQDLLLRVQVESPFKRELSRQRTFYDGLRSDNIIRGTDERAAVMDPFVYFRFRWTF